MNQGSPKHVAEVLPTRKLSSVNLVDKQFTLSGPCTRWTHKSTCLGEETHLKGMSKECSIKLSSDVIVFQYARGSWDQCPVNKTAPSLVINVIRSIVSEQPHPL
jgi:hypothetical protein